MLRTSWYFLIKIDFCLYFRFSREFAALCEMVWPVCSADRKVMFLHVPIDVWRESSFVLRCFYHDPDSISLGPELLFCHEIFSKVKELQ